MVTIDMISEDDMVPEIMRYLEAGEIVRVMRGERFEAMLYPGATLKEVIWDTCNWNDDDFNAACNKMQAEAFAAEYPDDDFSDWGPPERSS